MSDFEQLLTEKKNIKDNIRLLKTQSKELDEKIEDLYKKLDKTNSEIGELRHVNMHNDLINMAHSQGKKIYYCEGKICITEHCEKGRELSNIHKGGQEYIEMRIDDFRTETFKGRFDPHRLYFMDGEVEVIKGELKLKFGC